MKYTTQLLGLACTASLAFTACSGDDSGGDTGAATTGDPTTGMTVNPTSADDGMTDDAPMTDDGMTDDAPMTDDGMTDDAPMTDDGVDSSDDGMTTTGGATLPLILNLSGYPHVGADLHVKIFDGADAELGEVTADLEAQEQTYQIDNVVEDGGTYTVRWWVDVMDNDTCDPEPGDHMWEAAGETADATGLTLDHTHDANWTNVCDSW